MNLTTLGVGFIIGNMIGRLTVQKSVDDWRWRSLDIALTCVGLFLIVGSRYHLFGG